jgi:hypothetical protein
MNVADQRAARRSDTVQVCGPCMASLLDFESTFLNQLPDDDESEA